MAADDRGSTAERLEFLADLASIPGVSLGKLGRGELLTLLDRFCRVFPDAARYAGKPGNPAENSATGDKLVLSWLEDLHSKLRQKVVPMLEGRSGWQMTSANLVVDLETWEIVEIPSQNPELDWYSFLQRLLTPGRKFPFRRCAYEPCHRIFAPIKGQKYCSTEHRTRAFDESRRVDRAAYMRRKRAELKARRDALHGKSKKTGHKNGK